MQNLAAWGVAGGLYYYIWVRPERQAEQDRLVGLPCKEHR